MSELLTIPRLPLDGDELESSVECGRRSPTSRSTQLQLLRRFSQPYDGTPRELRVFDDAGEVVASYQMTKPLALVGQCRLCDVLLPHSDVSFRHAWFQVLGGQLLAVDLHSRTGVRWSHGPQRFGWVSPGESLMIGPYRIQYLAPGIATQTPSLPACDSEQLFAIRTIQPTVMLEPLNGTDANEYRQPQSIPIRRCITLIGHGSQCQIRLCDPRVSRVHCGLMLVGSELWIVDLLGKNGTRVNGTGVKLARLDAASELQVGPFRFAIHYPNTWSAGPHGWSFGFTQRGTMDSSNRDEYAGRSAGGIGTEPPNGVAGGFSEQFVMSLMDRMMDMHQQMMTQSQQQMLLMTQMLGAMQQSYRDVIQEEVQQLREITREIQQLQAKLLEQPADAAPAAAPPVPQAGSDSVLLPMLMGALLQSSYAPASTSSDERPADIAPVPSDAVDQPQPSAPADARDSGAEFDVAEMFAETATAASCGPAPDSLCLDRQANEPGPPSQPRGVATRAPAGNEIQHHVWLAERMHKLERERNGLLARIVQRLSGQRRESE